jgi:hypothetical protein
LVITPGTEKSGATSPTFKFTVSDMCASIEFRISDL